MVWTLQPQERNDQKYFFNGRGLITKGALELVPPPVGRAMIATLQKRAIEEGGIDYLQVFRNEDDQKVWVIDQLDEDMKESGDFDKEHDFFTILLPSEY